MDLDTHGYTISNSQLIGDAFVSTVRFPVPKDMKYDDGKIQAAILFQDFSLALAEIAKVATMGAKKYSRHGWLGVPNKSERYEDAMIRHLLAYNNNEEFDPESGLSHRAHFAWGALATLQMYLEGRDNKVTTSGSVSYDRAYPTYPIPGSTGDYTYRDGNAKDMDGNSYPIKNSTGDVIPSGMIQNSSFWIDSSGKKHPIHGTQGF